MSLHSLPPDIPEDDGKEETYQKRKSMLMKHYEAVSRVNYAFGLLRHTSWWIGWRGSMISLPHIVYGKTIPTAAVALNPSNGTIQLYFNGDWVQNLSSGDLAFVYAHETLHAVYDHMGRRKSQPRLWNIVCDAFINEYLHRYLDWSAGVDYKDRLDYTLKEGVRWSSLPEEIQKQYPVEDMNLYSADQIYFAMLEYNKEHGVDTKIFQRGRRIKKAKDPNAPKPGKPVRSPVAVKPGDIVFVKSKKVYGKIVSIKRDSKNRIDDVEIQEMPAGWDPKTAFKKPSTAQIP